MVPSLLRKMQGIAVVGRRWWQWRPWQWRARMAPTGATCCAWRSRVSAKALLGWDGAIWNSMGAPHGAMVP